MTTIDFDARALGPVAPVPLRSRLHAVWRADVAPTLLVSGLILALIIALAFLVRLVPVQVNGREILVVTSIADSFGVIVIVLAIILGGSLAAGRRESLLGGWTRAERLQVLAVEAIAAGVVAVLGRPALQPLDGLLARLSGAGDAPASGLVAWSPPLGLLALALLAAAGVFVGPLFVAVARVHWLLVVLVAVAVFVVLWTTASAFGLPLSEGVGPARLASTAVTLAGPVVLIGVASWLVLRSWWPRFR